MTKRAAISRSWAVKDSTNKAIAKATKPGTTAPSAASRVTTAASTAAAKQIGISGTTPPIRTPPANGTPPISRLTRATATTSLPASTIAVVIRARTSRRPTPIGTATTATAAGTARAPATRNTTEPASSAGTETALAAGAGTARVPDRGRSRTSAGEIAMSNAVRQEPAHRRPHAAPLASPFLEFDLAAEVEQLHREETWKRGRNTRTLMKYDDLRVVLT